MPGWFPRSVVWRRVMDDQSFELMTATQEPDGFRLCGTVLAAQDGVPLKVDYRIACDAQWQTRTCAVEQVLGGERNTLMLTREGTRWQIDGVHAPALDGCTDVDLGISPSTNTLAIHRLALAIGNGDEIEAAWIRFPQLSVTPARQAYRRLDERRYAYRSLLSDFKADIDVDDSGLVVVYERVWQRLAVCASDTPLALPQLSFAGALVAEAPSPDLGAHAGDFGWLVGCWSGLVRDIDADGTVREGTGEWWFSWVLEGRAMQDVWIVPPRGIWPGPAGAHSASRRYGTTVRTFDSKSGTWTIRWSNPVSGARNELAGARIGDRIVLEGQIDEKPARWMFEDITPARFVWRGQSRTGDGGWKTDSEFVLTKRL